jgi:phosphoglycerol transferase MdoB-like AlkP superfamily enzyme
MQGILNHLIKLLVYWLLIFLSFRFIFIFTVKPWEADAPLFQVMLTFIYGLRLDMSAIAYIMAVPFLLNTARQLIPGRATMISYKIYHGFVLLFVILIYSGNMVVYKHWDVLINNRAVAFLSDPAEVLASASWGLIVFGFAGISVSFLLLWILFKRLVLPSFDKKGLSRTRTLIAIPLSASIIILMMRGGVQQIPINESASYFSKIHQLNHIATNPIWHLGSNLKQSSVMNENPYEFMDDSIAASITSKLISPPSSDAVADILNTQRPNIILVILESWNADVIGPMGGETDVTPFFSSLTEEGVLFTRMYSSGFRTDQGLTSILSGFPSQPNKSIIRFTSKTQKLPSLPGELYRRGYNTSFYYGGELGFANMNSFLLSQHMNRIVSKADFDPETMNTKWGAHDEFIFRKAVTELDTMKQPFFSTILTLSTHEPFDVPINTPFNSGNESDKYRGAAFYTDSCLKEFVRSLKDNGLYDNTLLILIADHGHPQPKGRDFFDPEIRRIPFLLTGGVINKSWRSVKIDVLCNQHDVASTLLDQMKIPHEQFKWSVDILNPNRSDFVYISQDNAFVFKTDSVTRARNIQFMSTKNISIAGIPDDTSEIAILGNAYLQTLFNDFLNY